MNKFTKYILNKLLDLIYIIAIVTLISSISNVVPLIDALSSSSNVTRLAKVPPPETSSLSDRIDTIFATSPSGISPRALNRHHVNANNCKHHDDGHHLKQQQQQQHDLTLSGGDTDSDYSSIEDSHDDLSSSQNFGRKKAQILNDETSFEHPRPTLGCQTCNRSHDDIIEANLKSIRDLVLMKLGFSKPPNMTNKHVIPTVPKKIVDDFLKQHHQRGGGGRGKNRYLNYGDDMQSDDPNVLDRYYDSYPKEVYEEEDDDYFPITERVFVFPKSK